MKDNLEPKIPDAYNKNTNILFLNHPIIGFSSSAYWINEAHGNMHSEYYQYQTPGASYPGAHVIRGLLIFIAFITGGKSCYLLATFVASLESVYSLA